VTESSSNVAEWNSPARYVAVDTTEFFDCPYLDSPRWKQLSAFLQRTTTSLIVPEVVAAETKRHFRNSLTSALQKSETAGTNLKRLLRTDSVSIPAIDVDKACRDYELELERLLKCFGATIPPYSDVNITAIMKRCLENKKPFDSKGQKGFRDAVIWESILAVVKAPSETDFVTRNTSDFGEHGGLHESLREEIDGSKRSITICDGLDKFVDKFVKPALDILDGLKPKVEDSDFLYDLLHQVIHALDITEQVRRSLGGDICKASIDRVPALDSEVGDVYDLGDGLLSCSATFRGHSDVSFVEAEYEGPYEPVSYHGGDIPAHVEITVEITFRLIENDDINLEDFELDDVEIEFDF
jgi:hypothetical protein